MTDEVIDWLKKWSELIRAARFDESILLFDDKFFGFGTVAVFTHGREELLNQQWKQVWTRTSDFEFDYSSISVIDLGDARVIGARWTSNGIDSKTQQLYPRSGRATIILKRTGNKLSCVHT